MSKHRTIPLTEQDFCIYCQIQFNTRMELARHVVREHPSTYAYVSLIDAINEKPLKERRMWLRELKKEQG